MLTPEEQIAEDLATSEGKKMLAKAMIDSPKEGLNKPWQSEPDLYERKEWPSK